MEPSGCKGATGAITHSLYRAFSTAAVTAAYGWPADLTDDAILERLLALNLEHKKH